MTGISRAGIDGEQALALLQDVYQRAMRLNDTELSAEINGELGLLYASLAYEDEAVELLQTALGLYEQLGWQKNQITVLFNLARTYSYLEQYDQSLQTYNQMLQKSLQVQDNVNLYHAYLGLAITSSEAGQGDEGGNLLHGGLLQANWRMSTK